MTVVHTTLQVLTSLAKNCQVKFHPRFVKTSIFFFKVCGKQSHGKQTDLIRAFKKICSRWLPWRTAVTSEVMMRNIVHVSCLLDVIMIFDIVWTIIRCFFSIIFSCSRMLPLLSDSLLSQCLSRDWSLSTLSLVTSLLTPLTRHNSILKRLCSRSGKTFSNSMILLQPSKTPEC